MSKYIIKTALLALGFCTAVQVAQADSCPPVSALTCVKNVLTLDAAYTAKNWTISPVTGCQNRQIVSTEANLYQRNLPICTYSADASFRLNGKYDGRCTNFLGTGGSWNANRICTNGASCAWQVTCH